MSREKIHCNLSKEIINMMCDRRYLKEELRSEGVSYFRLNKEYNELVSSIDEKIKDVHNDILFKYIYSELVFNGKSINRAVRDFEKYYKNCTGKDYVFVLE